MSNHSHVLICITRDPFLRGREIAALVGITERAVQRIIKDLQEGGVVVAEKEGRRNRYTINPDVPLRHHLEHTHTVGELIRAIG